MPRLFHGTAARVSPGDVLTPGGEAHYQPEAYAGEGVYLADDPGNAYFYAVFGAFSSGDFFSTPRVWECEAPEAKFNQTGEWLAPSAVVKRDVTAEAVAAFRPHWPEWKALIEQTTAPGAMPNAAMICHEFETRMGKHASKEATVANPVRFAIVHPEDPEAALAQLRDLDDTADPHTSAYVRDLARQAAPLRPVNQWDQSVMHAVTKDGGFTFHDAVGDGPKSGYMVSVAKHTEVKVPVRGLTSAMIADYMAVHQQELRDPANYLGGWVYKGNVYLDVSRHVDSREEAMRLAREHQQLAIYDIGSGETLMTEPAAKAAFVVTRHLDPDAFLTAIQRAAGMVAEGSGSTCAKCGRTDLPYGQICRRGDGDQTLCLRCCGHNHG